MGKVCSLLGRDLLLHLCFLLELLEVNCVIILKTLSVGSIEALSGQIVDLLDNLIIHSIQHLSDLLLVTRLCVTLVFLRLFLEEL